MVSSSFFLGYILGGISFFPLSILITCTIYFTTNRLIYPIYSRYILNEKKIETNREEHQTISGQLYKVGWLRVQKGEITGDDDSSTIGDIVVSYISGNNHNQNNMSYFSVLKYNTLYLYDSERQLDCKEVITLNDYKVSIHPPELPDFELFSKTQYIKLENNKQSYYINCKLCIEKEDWYFAFIRAAKTTLPLLSVKQDKTHFDQSSMNHLINIIHSDEYHFQTQWFNALLGRIFLSVYRTQEIKKALYQKIVSKLDKINSKRPPFLGEITVRSVDPGHAVPRITHPKLLGISPTGELSAEANIHYDGCVRIEIETKLKWKYSDRLKPFTIDIILAITLESISGKVALKVKEPPTNRFWYAFYEPPKMKWKVEPVVWEKRVGYSMVVKAIETKIQEFIAETMVLPNWDDIVFFPTNTGGIFEEQEPPKETQEKKHRPKDEDLLITAKSLPELFQQQKVRSPLDPYSFPLSVSPPEDLSTCSTVSSLSDDSLQPDSLDIQPTPSKESAISDTSHVVRLRKSSSLALLNNPKTCPSTAVNILPAMAHREKRDLIDRNSIESCQ